MLATVIGRPVEDRGIVDAGMKSVTRECGVLRTKPAGATQGGFSEEHGELLLKGEARGLPIGDEVHLILFQRRSERQVLPERNG